MTFPFFEYLHSNVSHTATGTHNADSLPPPLFVTAHSGAAIQGGPGSQSSIGNSCRLYVTEVLRLQAHLVTRWYDIFGVCSRARWKRCPPDFVPDLQVLHVPSLVNDRAGEITAEDQGKLFKGTGEIKIFNSAKEIKERKAVT